VARALVRAVSRLVSTPVRCRRGVDRIVDAARTSACATRYQILFSDFIDHANALHNCRASKMERVGRRNGSVARALVRAVSRLSRHLFAADVASTGLSTRHARAHAPHATRSFSAISSTTPTRSITVAPQRWSASVGETGVWRALVRAVSRLISTPVRCRRGVSACATRYSSEKRD